VRNGHYDISQLLLENGADPFLVSRGDEYPIYHAIMSEDTKMIALLKKYDKDN
jgi:ankyrin repeat protein